MKHIPILYFSNETERGGAEEHLLALLRGLDRRLFRLHLACTDEMAKKLEPDLPDDVEVFRVTLRKAPDFAGMIRLARILRGRQIGDPPFSLVLREPLCIAYRAFCWRAAHL